MTDDTQIDPYRPCREPVPAEVHEWACQEAGIWGPLAETLRLWRVEGLAPVEVAQKLSITLGVCLERLRECLKMCREHDWSRSEWDVLREIIEAHANKSLGGSPQVAIYDDSGRRVGAHAVLVLPEDLMRKER